ncbi:MAG: hypothetical protein COY82_00295 [Parcubacteria group bacterium CG_4_10_14_0_8_um_filter_35_7]|nr:MAG: hypothetical protein COX43_00550 [Parcubacteria group bacterium CG23_combo_of_CG06-09_8_20_14_all_35_9]PIY78844.1 MAG: hypothetical protein COY82_00295 [Parcubacteria group bacterium CG_4_10_14_0_8_um_filter_35_7]
MKLIKEYILGIPGLIISILIAILYVPLLFYLIIAHIIDYRILKSYYFKKQKWDLNICCGNTDSGGINADIIKRNVPNFVLIKNIYELPFEDKEFESVLCSHTIEHVKNPDKFYKELERISKNVTLLIPPFWDIASIICFRQHKWQFLTLRIKHVNNLPNKIRLPYWWYQREFGQIIKD